MLDMSDSHSLPANRWYHGVTRYQWTVLAIASIGWVFDVFEGQLFNITRGQLLPEVLGVAADDDAVKLYGDVILGIFLLGGTVGGVIFGSMADRLGRRPAMVASILVYSVFSGVTYFAQTWWQVAGLRFLVAMGVGGEWAVAASLVAEVFPARARTHASGIFHASSILGTWTATLTSLAVGNEWRFAYLIGLVPALLTLWVRATVAESESWKEVESRRRADSAMQPGSIRELLTTPRWAPRALLGMVLAAVGLATFWGVTVAGQDLARAALLAAETAPDEARSRAQFAYGIVQTAGGGLGLLAFAPLSVRLGRRRAFALMHVAGLVITPITCYLPATYGQLLVLLPVFGFLTLGMHAGYAIYFPELFPTHLRATGAGFCFNVGRIVAAPMLFFSGWLKARPDVDLRMAVSLLSLLFVVGLVCLVFLPETKDQPLPE
jgi:MFS family permease